MSVSNFVYLILFFVACWCGYYLYDQSIEPEVQIELDAELPQFTGNDLRNTSYTLDGVRNYTIHSNKLEHFSKQGITTFTKPHLIVFRQGDQQEWVINAKQGVLTKEQVLTLTGDVIADNQLVDASFDTLETQEIVINLKNKDFYSDKPITLTGQAFTNHANQMNGNFDTNVATLSNQVQGKYENIQP